MVKTASPSNSTAYAFRLGDVLHAIPERELDSLIRRLKIKVDEAKRIDKPSQVARALIALPELRDPSRLPAPTRELLFRIAEDGGVLKVPKLPRAVEPLCARGIVFARGLEGGGCELVLPIAYMLVLPTWEGENPRGIRALLNQVAPAVGASIAGHYLGRTAPPPVVLALEVAWEAFEDKGRLHAEVEGLAPLERKLLLAVDSIGGEVDTEELLELEREPMRLRGAGGATPSRRGVGFALERRGFLIPVHPNRHVIPAEVSEIVGAERRAERDSLRQRVRELVLAEDHAPMRAQFATDPTPLVVAMAMTDPSGHVRTGVGTPRSLLTRLANRFGSDEDTVSFLATLSRAVGLWDEGTLSPSTPPGKTNLGEVPALLYDAWRRGGAWDEARPDPEVLRAPGEARESSAVGVLREMVIEALGELGDGRWVPWKAIAGYVESDSRTPGVNRLIERWAGRVGCDVLDAVAIAKRIALTSLHLLGMVDLGDVDADPSDDEAGTTLRLTPRGRAQLLGQDAPPVAASRFSDNQQLRVGDDVSVYSVLALAPLADVGSVTGALDLALTPQTLSRAVSAGMEPDVIRARVSELATPPDAVERMLVQASAVLGRAELVPCSGFLWVDDPEVRELLRTRRGTQDLFVDPSPVGGLLLAANVDIERVAQRCRALGVEIVIDGEVYRTRSTAPPRRRSSSSVKVDYPTGLIRRRSSGSMKAAGRKSSGSMKAAGRKSSGSMKAAGKSSSSMKAADKAAAPKTKRSRKSSVSMPKTEAPAKQSQTRIKRTRQSADGVDAGKRKAES